jgi:hypothetical protein
MKTVMERHKDDPAYDTFTHLDALRSYGGNDKQKFVEIVETADDMTPPINAPMPKHPC